MSAQIYPAQTYAHTRKPFSNANYAMPGTAARAPAAVSTPPKKAPSSPPLPRQNVKTAPPSPPQVIQDTASHRSYTRTRFLGEGGFARVYEVIDGRNSSRVACKVVSKGSLKTKKAKTKLYAEIKIHRALTHKHIVGFLDVFEDSSNVYMTLSLCQLGSLMDLLRIRKRFTEPETRILIMQIVSACEYMHGMRVIHRDLKLGNLFLDFDEAAGSDGRGGVRVKVGDFGLAALIETEGERKKTICGTPNYIAPEVLFDTANGHSFEVDTWSVGVILYTLLCGKPPFQTKDVKEIYKRIRDNDYSFPAHNIPSLPAQRLITSVLTTDPNARPSLRDLVEDSWVTTGPIPSAITKSSFKSTPDYSHLGRRESSRNYTYHRQDCGFDIPPPNSEEPAESITPTQPERTVEEQEKEFAKAIQPGSPISALLSSARRPLVVGNSPLRNGTSSSSSLSKPGETQLYRKLVSSKRSSPLKQALNAVAEEAEPDSHRGGSEEGRGEEKGRKELESQKARILVQMVGDEDESPQTRAVDHDKKHAPLQASNMKKSATATSLSLKDSKYGSVNSLNMAGSMKERDVYRSEARENEPPAEFGQHMLQRTGNGKKLGVHHPNSVSRPRTNSTTTSGDAWLQHAPSSSNLKLSSMSAASAATATTSRVSSSRASEPLLHISSPPPSILPSGKTGFAAAAQVLSVAFEERSRGRMFSDPRRVGRGSWGVVPAEDVFIVSWVDYCHKYGMGYALTDGSVGVHFNDSTTMILSPDKIHFDYITSLAVISSQSHAKNHQYKREGYSVSNYPEHMKSKVYLLKHFEGYIMGRLFGEHHFTFERSEEELELLRECRLPSNSAALGLNGAGGEGRGFEWVMNYLRMKHVIVFRLSNDALQFNFYDHTKIILCHSGLRVNFISKNNKCHTYELRELMAFGLGDYSHLGDAETKALHRLVDKVKYCKEVLVSITNASEDGSGLELGGTSLPGGAGEQALAQAPTRRA